MMNSSMDTSYHNWIEAASVLFKEPTYQIGKSYEVNRRIGPLPSESEFSRFVQRFGDWTQLPEASGCSSLGFPLVSELGVAAGPLLDSAWIKRYAELAFAFVTYKTVRTRRYPAHSWPNIVYVESTDCFSPQALPPFVRSLDVIPRKGHVTITNSFGIPSSDPYGEDGWVKDVVVAKTHLRPKQALIVSVTGTSSEGTTFQCLARDFAECARLAAEAGADVVEANLSCPNLGGGEENLYDDPEAAGLVAKEIRKRIPHTPLGIKLGYFHDLRRMGTVVKRISPFVDIITAINSVKLPVRRLNDNPALSADRPESGVCGYAIRDLGLANVRELCRLRDIPRLRYRYKVIGCGGVSTIEDISAYLAMGADAVETATAALWNPLIALQWNARRMANAS